MKQEELAGLTEEALLNERKKTQTSTTMNAVLLGVFIGVAIYSTVTNGLGFATALPLIFVYLAFRNKKKARALEDEVVSREEKTGN